MGDAMRKTVCLTGLLILLAATVSVAQLRLPSNAKSVGKARPQQTAAPAIDADAVGTYTTGPGGIAGFGYLLKVAGNATYAMSVSSCLPAGPPERGAASVECGELVLTSRGHPPTVTRYTAVAWGDRRYLIDDILAFANAVNLGDEPRATESGPFLLRVGDWKQAGTGLPKVPDAWTDKLLKEPIGGKVTATTESEATVDLGSENGVFVGMRLALKSADGKTGRATVKEVRDRDATIVPDSQGTFAAGDSVSSRGS
jgi:hypothetical protein